MVKRVALGVARCQMLHKGHTRMFHHMTEDFDEAIVGLGSTGRYADPANPWNQVQRQTMIRNVFGNRVKIVPLEDLGTTQGSNDWCDYVLEKCEMIGFAPVTDYFTGSEADAMWYKGRFWAGDIDRIPEESIAQYTNEDGVVRRLHINDRSKTIFPSATELRTFLAHRSDQWKPWVPAVNHELVETTYPEDFKVRI